MTAKSLIRKYWKKIYPLLFGKILKSSSGFVLIQSNDLDYHFKQKMVEEVLSFCQKQGYKEGEVEKIMFTSFYDLDMKNDKNILNKRIKAESETQIDIIELHGRKIALVCFGQSFSVTTE